jgi:hypothetical protein
MGYPPWSSSPPSALLRQAATAGEGGYGDAPQSALH